MKRVINTAMWTTLLGLFYVMWNVVMWTFGAIMEHPKSCFFVLILLFYWLLNFIF